MAVTFAEARRIVEREVGKDWRKQDGTLITMGDGSQDATHWLVRAGAREWLVEHNGDFVILDGPAYLVEKATGAFEAVDVLPNQARLNRMRPAVDETI